MDSNASNALALEYQRDYGTASRNLNVADLVNNPSANGVCRVFGLSFPEQGTGVLLADFRPLCDNGTNSFLVA
jgi:hypothetical protein